MSDMAKVPPVAWFACHQPARAVDPFVRWHYGFCSACHERACALAEGWPDDSSVAWLESVTRP